MKRLKFNKQFKDSKDMLSRIPSKYKSDDIVFEMFDGENKYKVRWEGNSKTGVGVILEHRNEVKEQEEFNRMMFLSEYDTMERNTKVSEMNEHDIFKSMINDARVLTERDEVKKKLNEVSITPIGDKSQNEYIKRNPMLTRMVQAALNSVLKMSPQLKVDGIPGKNTNTAIWIYNKRFNNEQNKRYLDIEDIKGLFRKLAGVGWVGGVGKGQKNNKRDVYALQTLLNAALGLNLVVDGIYGRNTQGAIDKFHSKMNLKNKKAGMPFDKESWYAMRRSAPSLMN